MKIAPRACASFLLALIVAAPAGAFDLAPPPLPSETAAESQPLIGEWQEPAAYESASRWTLWAGAIFLERSNPRTQTLVTENGVPLINANDLNFGTQGGVDLNAIRHGDVFDVEFRYFQVNGMSAANSYEPFGTVTLELADQLTFITPEINTSNTTSIQSVELNARRNVWSRLSVLAGFRYLALDDDLGQQFDVTGDGLSMYNVHVDALNRLYGAQIGADAILFNWGRFHVASAVKVGIYGNEARNQLRVSVLELPTTVVGRSAAQTAFVGDWNFTGIYQINDIWAVRGGYQLLWLSGMALSSEQYPVTFNAPIPGLDVITNGDLFLHGALVGLEASW